LIFKVLDGVSPKASEFFLLLRFVLVFDALCACVEFYRRFAVVL
jgi:hypothetical protein